MLDFTSALYLGMHHSSLALHPWKQFTTGCPSALKTPHSYLKIAQALALFQGCEHGTIAPSTLHLFWDLFGILRDNADIIYVDSGTYPIARWGVERAMALGVMVKTFPHNDANALLHLLRQRAHHKKQPIVLTDGWCPHCGKFAPIPRYLNYTRKFGGLLIIDDTQALGIFGHTPGPDAPYGVGGGGSLRRHNIEGPDVIAVSSLAKGFGVPMAVLAGCKTIVKCFERESKTRIHCSPPSVAAVHAASHALFLNRRYGETLRKRLAQLVSRFCSEIKKVGLNTTGGLSPVQTLGYLEQINTIKIYKHLLRFGVHTILRRSHKRRDACISFIITARHTPEDIDKAIDILCSILENKRVEASIFSFP